MRQPLSLLLLLLFGLSLGNCQGLRAQVDAYYTPGEPGSEDRPEVLLNSFNLNVHTGLTDIQYLNAKLLPPEPALHLALMGYLPIYKPMAQLAIGAETGTYAAMSLRLQNQYHLAVPVLAHLHYGAGAYTDARKWVGFGAGFGLEPHWTLQQQETVAQETSLTGFLEFTIYRTASTGMAIRYQSSLLSSYYHKQVFSANFLWHIPF